MSVDKPIEQVIDITSVVGESPEGIGRHDAKVYLYTFGMARYELPDLMIRDIPQFLVGAAADFLNYVCDRQRKGQQILLGEQYGDSQRFLMEAVVSPVNWTRNPSGIIELVPVQVNSCEACRGEG